MRQILLKFMSAITGIGLLCTFQPTSYAYADPAPEYSLKAAFIYNFATFTEWPTKTTETIDLCLVGNSPFGSALSSIEGKLVNNARLLTRHAAISDAALRNCQIIFISASEKDRLPDILRVARESGILTIADFQDAAQQGVMIGMTMEQKKITFEINLEATRRAKLNLSSKLLRLAKTVY